MSIEEAVEEVMKKPFEDATDDDKRLRSIDREIRHIILALWNNDVYTTWSCSGKPKHMCSRPTIVIPAGDPETKDKVEKTMDYLGIKEYWFSRVFSHVHGFSGMQDYWMLEIPNPRIDWIAYPIAYRGKKR